MAWFEVKKINKNFLKETLDSKIKAIGSKLFTSIKSIADVIVQYTNSINSIKTAVWKKQVFYYGNTNTQVTISVAGRGEMDLYALVNAFSDNSGDYYFGYGKNYSTYMDINSLAIDGVSYGVGYGNPISFPITFGKSLSITFKPSCFVSTNSQNNMGLNYTVGFGPYLAVITLDE